MSFLVFDLHGSVAGLCTAGATSIAEGYRYDGWGVLVTGSGTAPNPWRYRGLLNIGADSGTGALLDMAARDYSPQLGTFTQEDSVAGGAANPATMNRFLYALANPATLVDPDGHRACLDAGEGGTCEASGTLDTQVSTRQIAASAPFKSKLATPPTSVAPVDEGIFTGYDPWALQNDPTYRGIKDALYQNCRTPSDPGCEDLIVLGDWESRNRELYCSFHRADCDSGLSHELHDTLGALGMLPFIGVAFDGADTLLYIAEGNGGGSLLALGSMIPIVGDAGRAGKIGLESAGAAASLSKPSSRLLGANLEAAGFAREADSAAHHIVAGSASKASAAKAMLKRFDIDINDAGNGVFLPGTMKARNATAAVHSRIHTNAYYQEVNRLIGQATSRSEVLEALAYIRSQLLGGGFP